MGPAQKTHVIKIHSTDIQFPCDEAEFVLEAMKRSGCGPLHYGCFGGGCGICKMRIVSGEYRIEKKMSRAHISPEEEEDGVALICCIKPCEDLRIEQV